MTIYPLLLSGGSGSRLWPLSRQQHPKQFLALGEDKPLLVQAALRAQGENFAAPTVVCNHEHRFLVADSLHQAGIAPARIVLEPAGRNTAAAIAVGVLAIAADNPKALILAMPSDHIIADVPAFHQAIATGSAVAQQGHLVTFGITPIRPETGYGYIQQGDPVAPGVLAIRRFVEKPDAATAAGYLAQGDYAWNAGIFLFRADSVLEALRAHALEVLKACEQALAKAVVDLDFVRLEAASFSESPSVPFDVAVMEKASHCAVVPVSMGWSDIGSWASLWEVLPKDTNGNAVQGEGSTLNSSNCLVWSGAGLHTALIGVTDVMVVAQDDAVLVAHKDQAEQVKILVQQLDSTATTLTKTARTVYRPWGHYTSLAAGDGHLIKRIEVKPGAQLSLQYHHHRAEHWVVISGEASVTKDNHTFVLKANESTFIPLGVTHRLENKTTLPLVLIEVQTGSVLSEEDIVRLHDSYGRAEHSEAQPGA
jgi:mannose-1-phosphate guanylyltransferase/mannose-6-phosphate isomerase